MPANKLLLPFPIAMGSRYKSLSEGRRLRARKSSPSSSSRAVRKAASCGSPIARSSWKRSSRCCASSSAISTSRAGESFSGARRRRISGFHSGIFCLRDAIDAGDKFAPAAKLRSEDSAALASDPIITAAALAAFFNPAAKQPAATFQAVEHGVKRGHVERYCAARALLDEFADFVTVARASLDEREDEEFGTAPFPIRL